MVNQSCRGTSGSGGRFEPFANELHDGADTVAWLRTQPWFTGGFGLVGASYLGFAAWAIMVDPPPELATAVIAITAHDNHWVVHGAGAFSLEQMLTLLDGFGHYDRGMLGSTMHAAASARALRRTMDELPLVRAQETLLAGTGMPYAQWLTAPDPDDPVWRTTRFGAALDSSAGWSGWRSPWWSGGRRGSGRHWTGSTSPCCCRPAGRTASPSSSSRSTPGCPDAASR